MKARRPNPGYDELRRPWFVAVMLLAVLVLLADTAALLCWLRACHAALKGLA